MPTDDLTLVLQRLDAIAAQVAYVAERQRKHEELLTELAPIGHAVMARAIERLDALEREGYFAFVEELVGVGKRVVGGFTPEDVRQLGDAIVSILDTVRALTQPDVLKIAADATAAVRDADQVKPMGVLAVARAARTEDVGKGIALLVEVLRRVGHGVNVAATAAATAPEPDRRRERLAALLGPRRTERPQLAAPPRAAASSPGAPRTAAPAATATVVDGVAFGADGHLVDASAWTRALAGTLARAAGVVLTDAHWAVIDAARADFAATTQAPNVRRLTQVAAVTTRDLYVLFPKAPGRTIARIAGLPKPTGCL